MKGKGRAWARGRGRAVGEETWGEDGRGRGKEAGVGG